MPRSASAAATYAAARESFEQVKQCAKRAYAIGGAIGESRRALRDSPDAPGNSTFSVFGAMASPSAGSEPVIFAHVGSARVANAVAVGRALGCAHSRRRHGARRRLWAWRHARYLATLGYRVTAVDRDVTAVAVLDGIRAVQADLEGTRWPF